ncbi:ATP-binding protein [Wielerella bovis]|uniref:ATP-binding protein n=1 Tax=Wielerella bovis TaxID=2917790 RepID=UPI002018BD16|nr:ATP-binding protein [Wielerella bovis]ULJ65116.1 ATP-binding protein [Wielerella bovis]ULJ67390.1 ATP-binding protein [Wielerella bovis]
MSKISLNKLSGSGLSRYYGMIVSISIFLVFITALMGTSIYLSSQVQKSTEQHYVAEQLHQSELELMQSLLSLKLSYGEDPNSPHMQTTLKSLSEAQDTWERSLTTLQNGGLFKGSDNMEVKISALQGSDNTKNLATVKNSWTSLSSEVNNYLKVATSPTATSTSLDLAVLQAQAQGVIVDEATETILANLQSSIQSRSSFLNTLQTVGIAIAMLYLILFLVYFVRKLVASDQEAEAARRETTEIMDTVNTGLFLLDSELNIGSQYSKELENLVGQTNLGGKNLMDVLSGMISDEDLNTTHAFIGQLYNQRTKERLISSLNPLTRQPVNIPGRDKNDTRYLDFKFNRVYHGTDISRVLVGVSDVTDAVLLEQRIEQEREQNDVQLEMLSTILQADRRLVDDFVRNVKRRNTNINNVLKAPGERQPELRDKVNTMFREVHSMKGEASTLKLHGFTVLAENLENELNRLSKVPSLSGEHFLGLAVHLDELMKLTQTIEDLVSRLGGSGPIHSAHSGEAHTLANYYTKFVSDLAQRNNKSVDFSYVGVEETKDETTDSVIREIAVQVLRNAVVHGIETPEERQSRRKLATGHVRMELLDQGNQFSLVLEDDGKGLDYEAIRAKAVRIGKYSEAEAAQLGNKELLALIFSPGFSTLDKSTEDAGRGVGLDIIKDRVSALGGKIGVSTHAGSYTRFSFTFPKK